MRSCLVAVPLCLLTLAARADVCGQNVPISDCPTFSRTVLDQQRELCIYSNYCDPYRCDPDFLSDLPTGFTCACDQLVLSPNAEQILYGGEPWDFLGTCANATDPGTTGCPVVLFMEDWSVEYSDCPFQVGCFGETSILRIWRAVDGDGVAHGCPLTQIITISPFVPPFDTEPTIPVVTLPLAATVGPCDSRDPSVTGLPSIVGVCGAEVLNVVSYLTANCDPVIGPQVCYSDSAPIPGECEGAYDVTRTWTVRDLGCTNVTGTQTIHVRDTTPPLITCPPDVNVTSTPGNCTPSAVNLGSPSVTDCSSVTIANNAPITFPAGTTTVTWTATDTCGNESTCHQNVTVQSAQQAHVTVSIDKTMLWPPNHDLINVGLGVMVNDPCNPNASATVAVYSNEDDTVVDDGETHSPDARNVAASTLRLRSERTGSGTARVYLIVVRAVGSTGTTGLASATVVVPHSRSGAAMQAATNLAAAAQASLMTTGNAPGGYYLVGDGAVIGPKQ
jgi:hypothetical protein